MSRRLRYLIGTLCVLGTIWALNSSRFVELPPDHQPRLIAHRGVHHIYAGDDRSVETCRAAQVTSIDHGFIENTLPSMRAAFENGADVVELDVHLTTDSVFAVFHDWRLDCQTDGRGVTHEQSFDALRQLDIGYGFSVDGAEFPLRGQGIGLMPSLSEVLEAEFGKQYLINFKSNRAAEGHAFARLEYLDDARVWGVYGGENPTRTAIGQMDGLRGFDRAALKACALRYILIGWTGIVPDACSDRIIAVPMDLGKFLWGWPHRFTKRMRYAGTDVILWGPYDGSGFSSGIDDEETLSRVPEGFDGYLWTNRIEVIGPLLKGR